MSIKSPTVSAIVSAQQDSQYLLATINSVRQQTFADLEIIILYCGHSDKLVQWFERQDDPRLRLICSQDLNLTKISNLGISQARGEYIAFIRGEDLWHRQKLQKQVFLFNCYPTVGLIHSWLTPIQGHQRKIGHRLSGWVEPIILERNLIGYSSTIVRRSCFDKVGVFDPKLSSAIAWDLWIRLSRHYQFMTVPESLVYYRQPQDKAPESWLKTETDLQAAIEKAYSKADSELLLIKKNRTYAYASLVLAKKVLEHHYPDPAIAHNYCRQALEHSPKIGISREFLQVSFGVIILHWLKSERYRHLLITSQNLGWLQIVWQKFRQTAHVLLNWMLDEEKTSQEEISDSALNFKE